MYHLMLSLAVFLMGLQEAFPVTIQLLIGGEENIIKNLVGYDNNSVKDLTPPLVKAKNYFSSQADKSALDFTNSYIIEIYKNHMKIKTTGLPSQKIKLNKTETEGIQKLSLSFVELLNSSKLSSQLSVKEEETLNWKDMSPIITLSNSGVSLQFLQISKVELNATEISPENKKILWDFLTKYARNIFEEKLKQLNLIEKYAEIFDSPVYSTGSFGFQDFVDFLWSIMKLSVDYAETTFKDWTTSPSGVTTQKNDINIWSTTVTLFAYEEPSPFHEFPSHEFLYRKKDVDSIFYGRGVI